MVTQLHNTHIFELAKQVHAERLHEARVAHLLANQKRERTASLGALLIRLASLAALWPVHLLSRSQTVA